jgi:hypothetical protein
MEFWLRQPVLEAGIIPSTMTAAANMTVVRTRANAGGKDGSEDDDALNYIALDY